MTGQIPVWLHSVWRCHKSQPLLSHQLTSACKCISPSRLPHLPANMTWYQVPCIFGTAKAVILQFLNLEHKQDAPSSSFDPPKWWTLVWSGGHGPTWSVEMICGASYRRCLGWCNDLIELANGLWTDGISTLKLKARRLQGFLTRKTPQHKTWQHGRLERLVGTQPAPGSRVTGFWYILSCKEYRN